MCIEEVVVEHGAPTLAGLKTANLFPVRTDGEDIVSMLRKVNQTLVGKGIRAIPVKKQGKRTLVYLFRPDRLRKDLQQPEAARILREKGYPGGDTDQCLHCLIRHLNEDETFPHEIGLFLGYPPSDVRGFMNSPQSGVKCTGCWKAYGNQEEAEKLFAKFRKCSCIYRRRLKEGRSLESLAV